MQWHHLPMVLILITAAVIAVGGTIRIYDAGESCPDWPLCFGTLGFDISPEEQAEWWEENPEEIDSRGENHRYTTFQIFTEWFHRLLAGSILGPLVILQFIIVRKEKNILSDKTQRIATLSLALVIWQGFIGYITVKWDNEHWSVALHLLSALIFTLSLIALHFSWQRDIGKKIPITLGERTSRRLTIATFGSLAVLLVGAFVSTTEGANEACGVSGFPNSWPLCSGTLGLVIQDVIIQSQAIHRWLVITVFLILIWFGKEERWASKDNCIRKVANFAGLTYFLNMILGAAYILTWTVESGFYEWLSVFHLLLASLTFLLFASTLIIINIHGNDISEDE